MIIFVIIEQYSSEDPTTAVCLSKDDVKKYVVEEIFEAASALPIDGIEFISEIDKLDNGQMIKTELDDLTIYVESFER